MIPGMAKVRSNIRNFARWVKHELLLVEDYHLAAKRAAFGAMYDDLVEESPVSNPAHPTRGRSWPVPRIVAAVARCARLH